MDKLLSSHQHPSLNILIIGAGIAGLTAAYWLNRYGFTVDIIEKAPDFNHRLGYVIDFWGPGFAVLEKMHLVPTLQTKHYALKEFIFVNESGNQDARFSIPKFRQLHNQRVFTLLRGDLESVLRDLISDDISIQCGVGIEKILNEGNKVHVQLSDKKQEEYDIVIGADGIHSNTRQLVFGDESQFARHLGYQLAAAILPNNLSIEDALYTYSAFGKQAAVCPIFNKQLATYFVYQSNENTLIDSKRKLQNAFKNEGWIIPALLENIKKTDNLFFDTLMQIEMPMWHHNRVVLVGDACQCLTLMSGQGASMAMAGAYVLANALHQHKNNIQQAFLHYETIVQSDIQQKQACARQFLSTFIAKEQSNNVSRNFFTRQFFKKMYYIATVDDYCRKIIDG